MHSKNICFLMILAMSFLLPSFALTIGQPNAILFTEEEATALDLSDLRSDDWSLYLNSHFDRSFGTRSLSEKVPRVEVIFPAVKSTEIGQIIETQSPTNLIVEFIQPPNGDSIDMSTLEVTGRKGLFRKSLTNKLSPFIEGTIIKASEIKIPSGKFHLEVSIASINGNRTDENYILVVK